MAELIVRPKTGDPFVHPLRDKRVAIGRSPENDIVLTDPFSSGRHALIVPRPDGSFALVDLGSKNGTFVNGERVSGEIALAPGDEIAIGSTRIHFEKEAPTRVNIVDGTTFTHSSQTILGVREVVETRPTAARLSTPGGGLDADRFKKDQRLIAVMNEVSQALIYHLPLDRLLDHIMDVLLQQLPMDRGVLMLQDPITKALEPRTVRVLAETRRPQSILISRTIVRKAVEKNSAILISDVPSDESIAGQKSIIQGHIHSAMCVPLWNNEAIIGLIYCDRSSYLDKFTEEDLRLLTLLANLAAVKIENARLAEESEKKRRMEEDLARAAEIQRNFLPRRDPDFEPYEIRGDSRACAYVGGDYYDYLGIDQDRLALVIADVSGVGVPAAMLMSSLRASLKGALDRGLRGADELAALVSRLNDFVCESTDSHGFISFFLGVLDRRSGEMTYVNAGHNPPLILEPGGRALTLESTGLCLGMFPGQNFGVQTAAVGPGSVLGLYTDGIIEGRPEVGEEYGTERLFARLKECAGGSAGEIIERVYEDVLSYTGCGVPGDDMTLVIVKNRG